MPRTIREITLGQLIQLIEENEMVRPVVKNKKAKAVEEPAKKKKSVEVKASKNGNGKVSVKDIKATTKDVKSAKKGASPVATAKKKKGSYTPQKDSMRYFVYQALKQGVASTKKIKLRAAKLASKAGISKYANADSYSGFDIAFFVKMLEEKGVDVERDGEKYAVNA